MIVIGFDSSGDEEALKCLEALQLFKLVAYPVNDPLNKKVVFRKIRITTVYRKE